MKIGHFFATAAAASLLAIGPALTSAQAREVMTDEELSQARGGILIAGDIAFEFGAVVKTYEDGALSLETQVTWTPTGPLIQQLAGTGVTPLSDPDLKVLAGMGDAFRTAAGATVIQNVSQGQVLNLLMNTTSGHQFRQDTAITLVLPGFASTQAAISRQVLGLRLGEEVRGASFLGLH